MTTARVLVIVPTLGQRDVTGLVRAIARESASIAGDHDVTPLLLHNGSRSEALAELSSAEGLGYDTHGPMGYSEIRNEAAERAVDGGFDILVMMDDDELPSPGWLAALLAPFRLGADVVVGPVLTAWPEGTPRAFARSALPRAVRDLPDGWVDIDLRSGNCAIRVGVLGSERFDPRFNIGGGEDTALFRRLRAQGARCYWASSASVTELVDRERVRLRYFARRSFSQGRSHGVIVSLVPRPDDPSAGALLRARAARSARLALWTVRDRNPGRLLEMVCEVAFLAGFARSRLATRR